MINKGKKEKETKQRNNKKLRITKNKKGEKNNSSDSEDNIYEKNNSNNISYDNEQELNYGYEEDYIEDNEQDSGKRDEFIKTYLENIISNYHYHGLNILSEEIDYKDIPDIKYNFTKLGEENYRNLLKEYHPAYKPVGKRKRNNDSNEEDIDNSFNDRNNGNKNKKKKILNNNVSKQKVDNKIEEKKGEDIHVIKENEMEGTNIETNNDKNVKEKQKVGMVFKYKDARFTIFQMREIKKNTSKNLSIYQKSSMIFLTRGKNDSFMYMSSTCDDIEKLLGSITYNNIRPIEETTLNLYSLLLLCNSEKNYLVIKGKDIFNTEKSKCLKNPPLKNNKITKTVDVAKNQEINSVNQQKKIDKKSNSIKKFNIKRSFKWIFGGNETTRKNLVCSAYRKDSVYEKQDLGDIWPNYYDDKVKVVVFKIEKNYDKDVVADKLVKWCQSGLLAVDMDMEWNIKYISYKVFIVLNDVNFHFYFRDKNNYNLKKIPFENFNCSKNHDDNEINNYFKIKED